MAANFGGQMGEIGIPTFIRHTGVLKGLEYRNADAKRLNETDPTTSDRIR